jgi:phage-related minor tail protein
MINKLTNMDNKERIEKMVDEALGSFDGAERATPKPFLLTRINARMDKSRNGAWETAARFIARPVVVIAGLCMVIAVNALVVAYNNSTTTTTTVSEQLTASTDEFSTSSVATLYDIDNIEP